ncbi:MAG: ABC transporter substrate-binding protein [Firmicutes bacterium]|uniref:ABC transporter substrate-binding protein n=1 Tax=Geochorda subterranea TaxID=3109564 RepID=A0ABZ1BMP9_9FIRM|nr:ABC transporter substrate-binding protein [Limnochorda sp. LNt]NLG68225.1 ABC transporter substrate-binding protein [Bacillota bacterium]WRP14057.1 ABC transporter substrate-binding protein [Limnochorda sp. LNt]
MRRRWIATAGALVATLLVAGAASAAEIVVGLNAELTGQIPVVGQSSLNGARMAVDEINQAGGLLVGNQRYAIRLQVEDNEDKAQSAVAAAQKLYYQHGVIAMVGPNASRNAVPAADIAESARAPMISPWSTNPNTTRGKRYVFRAAFTDDFQGRVVAAFARQHFNAQRAAVLYDVASEYNKGIAEVFRQTFTELGGQVVAFETYTTGDKDFLSQLTKIRAARPDILFLPNYYSEVPLQVQQARLIGLTVPIIGSDSWGFADLLTLGGSDMEGLMFTTHYAPDIATPVARRFIEAYQQRFGSPPDDVAALTYDSFQLLFQALQQAGRLDREAVRDALASIERYEGVTGTMQFRGSGDPIKSAVVIRIEDGQFKYFTTANP